MMQITSERVLCPSCKGAGYKIEVIKFNYHKREEETKNVRCEVCGGKGVVFKTVKIETIYEKVPDIVLD